MSVASPTINPACYQQSPRAAAAPSSNGRHVQHDTTSTDRNYAIWMHLSLLIGALGLGTILLMWIAPFVLWQMRKDESSFNNDHGREAMNFAISFIVLNMVLLAIPILGWVLIPVLWIISIIAMIRASIAASRSEYFRYPATIRFIS